MSITDDIRNAIASKLVICRDVSKADFPVNTICVICKKDITIDCKMYLYAKGEGAVCQVCGGRFAPEMQKEILENKDKEIQELVFDKKQVLDADEWKNVKNNIDALLTFSDDLAKGVARGIVEAPAGHIGLLYLAKDIVKPERKIDETEKDYDLRVKSFRIQKLQEKIRAEMSEKIILLQHYFEKLGLPHDNYL